MKTMSRVVLSIVALVAYWIVAGIYGAFQAAVEAKAAVAQAKDSIPAYAFGEQMARGNLIPGLLVVILLVVLFSLWLKPVMQMLRHKGSAGAALGLIAMLAVGFILTGCGPAHVQVFATIEPCETAFVIPLRGQTSAQAKFQSVKYLQERQVSVKQIENPTVQHDTGRGPGNYQWLPTVRVIKVNRAPVTREWTQSKETGTAGKNEAIAVESLESINFHVGVNATANILEEDAATYLYWFGETPLSGVMDANVRGYLQSILSLSFGKTPLEECKKQKGRIISEAAQDVTEHFKKLGINIMNLGGSEGLLYDQDGIQDSINRAAIADKNIEVAQKISSRKTRPTGRRSQQPLLSAKPPRNLPRQPRHSANGSASISR